MSSDLSPQTPGRTLSQNDVVIAVAPEPQIVINRSYSQLDWPSICMLAAIVTALVGFVMSLISGAFSLLTPFALLALTSAYGFNFVQEHAILSDSIRALEGTRSDLDKRVNDLTQHNLTLTSSLKQYNQVKENLELKINTLEEQIKLFMLTISSLSEMKTELEQEVKTHKTQGESLKETVSQLEIIKNHFQDEANTQKASKDELEKVIVELTNKLDLIENGEQRYALIQGRITEATSHLETIREQLSELQKEYRETLTAYATLQPQLQQQVTDLGGYIAALSPNPNRTSPQGGSGGGSDALA